MRKHALRWALVVLAGCTAGADLGECDALAAEELVYGRAGLVATKGQALAHDSCGNGVFCHSSAATGSARYGAPQGLNFDMLPSAQGLGDISEHGNVAWAQVMDGEMPPAGSIAVVVGDGEWSLDPARALNAPMLPSLATNAGKAAFRNWLACGSPVVVDTQVPSWAMVQQDGFVEGEAVEWQRLWDDVVRPNCATAGCHAAASKAAGLAMPDACGTWRALRQAYGCGQTLVVPGDADRSLLSDKVGPSPSCGGRMPPSPLPPLSDSQLQALRAWIDAGAEAASCQ